MDESDNFIMAIRGTLPEYDQQIENRKSCVENMQTRLSQINQQHKETRKTPKGGYFNSIFK